MHGAGMRVVKLFIRISSGKEHLLDVEVGKGDGAVGRGVSVVAGGLDGKTAFFVRVPEEDVAASGDLIPVFCAGCKNLFFGYGDGAESVKRRPARDGDGVEGGACGSVDVPVDEFFRDVIKKDCT